MKLTKTYLKKLIRQELLKETNRADLEFLRDLKYSGGLNAKNYSRIASIYQQAQQADDAVTMQYIEDMGWTTAVKKLDSSSMRRQDWRAFRKSMQPLPGGELESPELPEEEEYDPDNPDAQDYQDMLEMQSFYLTKQDNGDIWIAHEEPGFDRDDYSYTGPFASKEDAVRYHEKNTLTAF